MKIAVCTLGCKVNQYESQAMELLLRRRGHLIVAFSEEWDACIVNTCAVTKESGRKSRQTVRRATAKGPDGIVAVCGCYSQMSPDEAKRLGADLIGGSGGREEFLDALERVARDKRGYSDEAEIMLDNPFRRRRFEELPAGGLEGRTRAYLKIEDGCDNFCSYCIIPYARGGVRSLPLQKCGDTAAGLMAGGYKEIVITGIEISSYGKDLGDASLLDAVREIAAAAPGVRLRLGSLEPRVVTPEFAEGIKEIASLCPHFHLSLQSGCDETLSRMRRKYDTERYFESVSILRKLFPLCGITSDLITGFPGETEREFENTLAFIRKCRFSAMHIFPFSERPGTAAAVMEDRIDKKTRERRAREAGRAAHEMSRDFLDAQTGRTARVLFEGEREGKSRGHTENYCPVSVDRTGLHNRIEEVYIAFAENGMLIGKILP